MDFCFPPRCGGRSRISAAIYVLRRSAESSVRQEYFLNDIAEIIHLGASSIFVWVARRGRPASRSSTLPREAKDQTTADWFQPEIHMAFFAYGRPAVISLPTARLVRGPRQELRLFVTGNSVARGLERTGTGTHISDYRVLRQTLEAPHPVAVWAEPLSSCQWTGGSWIHDNLVNNHSSDPFAIRFLLRCIDAVGFCIHCQAVHLFLNRKILQLAVVIRIVHLEYGNGSA